MHKPTQMHTHINLHKHTHAHTHSTYIQTHRGVSTVYCNKSYLCTDFPMDVFQKPTNAYTEEQREFALTLHLYGPKAYEYLRNEIKVNLPHPRSLRRCVISKLPS